MSLQVENLRVYYQTLHGDVKALDGATFDVRGGEIMGLAGESGCGKTTLGHSLIRLNPPLKFVEGHVKLDQEELPIWDMEKMNAFRLKKISIIPQYAMNAMNPTRKIGKMIAELLGSRHVDFKDSLPELKRRLDLVKLPPDVLSMYPTPSIRRRVASLPIPSDRWNGLTASGSTANTTPRVASMHRSSAAIGTTSPRARTAT